MVWKGSRNTVAVGTFLAMETMRAADTQQVGPLLQPSSSASFSTKVPNARGARIRPQATRGLLRQRSIKAIIEPPVLPFDKDAEHLSQWRPESWRQLKAHQQPNYRDQEKLREAVETISRMPPLVFAGECRNLQSRLAKCAAGEAFLLQGQCCTTHFQPHSYAYIVASSQDCSPSSCVAFSLL
jgi:3-deoxy-7-phosphoheptulonate synthase